MPFSDLHGNGAAKRALTTLLTRAAIPGPLLLFGPDGVGKRTCALRLAAHMLHTSVQRLEGMGHPDCRLFSPDSKTGMHSMESLRELLSEAALPPLEASCKFLLLDEAHRMRTEGQGALLKTFEEPHPGIHLILITSELRLLVPPLVSRCLKLPFFSLCETEIRAILREQRLDESVSALARGSMARACELLSEERKRLAPLLSELLVQGSSHPALWSCCEAIQQHLEPMREQSPVRWVRQVQLVLEEILHTFRDRFGSAEGDRVLAAMEKGRLAIDRNVKLAVVLEVFYSTVTDFARLRG